MKQLIAMMIVLAALVLGPVVSGGAATFDYSANSEDVLRNEEDVLRRSVPDSVYSLIKGRPVIFFTVGHHGYIWSLVTRLDGGLRGYSGSCGRPQDGTVYVYTDSDSLLSANRALMAWGFDSMSTESRAMKGVKPETYMTGGSNLSVFDTDGRCVFGSADAKAFSGPDSVAFNDRFGRLRLLMECLAIPMLRDYISSD